MSKRAFITGITGQDGSYLAELLLSKGYEVHGLIRRNRQGKGALEKAPLTSSTREARLFLHEGDLNELDRLSQIVREIVPDEVYHLGAQSHVLVSFESPEYTFDVNACGTVRLLESLRTLARPVRFYHASTCEMFGRPDTFPQNEKTPFRPVSPYSCSKVASHHLTSCYREGYGLFACNGILFNHESPRRGKDFVTRKIARGVAEIKRGTLKKLKLGNLDTRKDWGYAPEYVEAMWQMLQQDKADDYVIATGESHRVGEFVELAFALVGLDWRDYVETDPQQIRPAEVGLLVGDASKARQILHWEPKVHFEELVQIMIEAELEAVPGSHG